MINDSFSYENDVDERLPPARRSHARDKALEAVRRSTFADPSKTWAIKILARHRRGEKLSSLALDWAEEVTGESRKMREPGEDD